MLAPAPGGQWLARIAPFLDRANGKQYIECAAGLWCTAIGCGNRELAAVAKEQMEHLSYFSTFGANSHEPAVLLAEKIKGMMPFDAGKVFFGMSGSDANDAQIKLAWYYSNAVGRPENKKIISRRNTYHGSTLGAGSLTGLAPFHNTFDPPIDKVLHTDYPFYYGEAKPGRDGGAVPRPHRRVLEDLIERQGGETIAAFIGQPIIGSGGVVIPPEGYHERSRTGSPTPATPSARRWRCATWSSWRNSTSTTTRRSWACSSRSDWAGSWNIRS